MTPELESVLDDETETVRADSAAAAAAAAGQDTAPMDVEYTRKIPAVTSATTVDVDGDAGAEEKKDDDGDDKKPSADGMANASSAAVPAPAPVITIRRNENGSRFCSVGDCQKHGRREVGWMCKAHYRELEKRDPAAAAAAAKAAAKATPIRRGHGSVPTFGGNTPGLEDVNTPTPIGTSQRSAKKPRVSSAELSSLLCDGPNGGIGGISVMPGRYCGSN